MTFEPPESDDDIDLLLSAPIRDIVHAFGDQVYLELIGAGSSRETAAAEAKRREQIFRQGIYDGLTYEDAESRARTQTDQEGSG